MAWDPHFGEGDTLRVQISECYGGSAMRFSWLIFFGALALAAQASAGPAPKARPKTQAERKALAKKLFDEAEKNYYLGRFEQALKLYSKAYEVLPLPGFLFNIGQCHRMMGNYERAIFFYRGYLRAKDARNKEIVERLIKECQDKAREQKRAQRAERQAAVPPKRHPTAAAQPARPARQAPALATKQAPERAKPFYSTWWFWTAVGVGVAVLAAGIAGGVLAAGGSSNNAPPSGSLGTIDRRTSALTGSLP